MAEMGMMEGEGYMPPGMGRGYPPRVPGMGGIPGVGVRPRTGAIGAQPLQPAQQIGPGRNDVRVEGPASTICFNASAPMNFAASRTGLGIAHMRPAEAGSV